MNNLPIKIDTNNIFYKIKTFFKRLLGNLTSTKPCEYTQPIFESKEPQKNQFKELISREVKEQEKEKNILEKIDTDPSIINTMSDEKLLELLEMYKKDNKRLDIEIAQLQN